MSQSDDVSRGLFEILTSLLAQSYENGVQIAALRAWVTSGHPEGPEEFEKVVAAARERIGPDASETLAAVQRLVAALKVPIQ